MDTTVKELVEKHNAMKNKLDELLKAINRMQGDCFHDTEVITKARKDNRYPVQLMVQEHDRIKADLMDLCTTPVRLLQ